MRFTDFVFVLLADLRFAAAVHASIRDSNAPGELAQDTLSRAVRGLSAVRAQKRDATFKSNKTVLDTSWTGATLLKQGLYVDPLSPLFLSPAF